jgi:hypothetical protein
MSTNDDNELPKQDKLLKLLKMTTSPNDGEALTAIRMANTLLTSAGWDWDKLISGKITIVEDPFKNLGAAPRGYEERSGRSGPPTQPFPPNRPAPAPPPRPAPAWPGPQPSTANKPQRPPPQPQPTPTYRQPYSLKANIYDSWCYACGDTVPSGAGVIFSPAAENPATTFAKQWACLCYDCNRRRVPIMRSPAPRQKPKSAAPGGITPNINDL